MTIVRVGSNTRYSDGWEQAFTKKKAARPASETPAGGRAAAKPKAGKAAPKATTKKSSAAPKKAAKKAPAKKGSKGKKG